MSDQIPPGPLETLAVGDALQVPHYAIPFDKKGRCTGARTRSHLLRTLRDGTFTHVFFFAHGWNADWADATRLYRDWMRGLDALVLRHQEPPVEEFRPLLVGIRWPSIILTFSDQERGPGIASSSQRRHSMHEEAAQEIAADLPTARRSLFLDLVKKDALDAEQARTLLDLVACLNRTGVAETPAPAPSAQSLLYAWLPSLADDLEEIGVARPLPDEVAPQAAASGGRWDPRQLLRIFTVWTMKDRAGAVGATGVAALLRDVLVASNARVHLAGHSFGAKVLLSALAAGPLPRRASSALLLQPAVSHLCFARRVREADGPGGYHSTLRALEQPILSTYSRHDAPLTRFYHWALRRNADLAEKRIAAPGEPPNRYAALGGFGPRESGEENILLQPPGRPYVLKAGVRLFGLDGGAAIHHHGDVSNPSTSWALFHQTVQGGRQVWRSSSSADSA